MRKLTLLLVLLVAVSFADVLFDQSYDGTLDNGDDYYDTYHQADDFSLTTIARLENIEWWSFYNNGVNGTFDIRLYEESGGLPGVLVWTQLDVTPIVTDTGDDPLGFDLYHNEVILDAGDYFVLSDGVTYWLSLNHDGSESYWGLWYGGNSALSSNGGGSWTSTNNTFLLRFNGTDNYSSIEEATWGQIKAGL